MRLHKLAQTAYLLVKIQSLSEESRIIRRQENHYRKMMIGAEPYALPHPDAPLPDDLRNTWLGLKSHRRHEVRGESRSAQLAYGYLRGVPYRAMEATCHEQPDWQRVERLIVKFGGDRTNLSNLLLAWRHAPHVTARSLAA